MIRVNGLRKAYGTNQVLDGVDLTVQKGETVALIGPSGTGKTTLLRMLNYLEQPDSGSIQIGDAVIEAKSATHKHIRALRSKTAMVFQHYNLFQNLTALQNVTESLLRVKRLPLKQAVAVGQDLMEKVGLADKCHTYPAFLSGGQQQRVGIARALAVEPQVMLFDEPTSALDPEWVGEVLAVMQQIALGGMTMLVVSHEMRFVRSIASRALFMDGGVILEDAPPDSLFRQPQHERTRQFLRQAHLE